MAKTKRSKLSQEEMMPILEKLYDQSQAFKADQATRYSDAWQYYQGNYPKPDEALGSAAVYNITKPYLESVYQVTNDIFFSSDNSVVRVKSENVDATVANDVSNALNTIAMNINEITRKMQDAQKECLLTGFACLKVSLEEKILGEKKVAFPVEDDSEGWTQQQLDLFVAGLQKRGFNDIDIKPDPKKTKIKHPAKQEKQDAMMIGKQLPKSYKVYSGNITAYARETKPSLDYIPFQEVFIHPHTRYTIDDSPYFCHSYWMSVADGIQNGWDMDVMKSAVNLGDQPVDDVAFALTGLNTRNGVEDATYDPFVQDASGVLDEADSTTAFRVYEHYWKGSYQGSIPKLWRFITTDTQYLEEPKEMSFHPFVGMRCDLIPNSFFGNGIIDETIALQNQASYELRLTNYTMRQAALGQMFMVKGQVDRRSLLDVRQGGVVIVDEPNSVGMLPHNDISNALQVQSQRTEKRIGTLASGAIDDTLEDQMLQVSGVALNTYINKQEQGPKSRAIVMAQTGLVPMYKKVYLLARELEHPVKSGADGYTLSDLPEDLGFTFDTSTLTDKQQDATNVIQAIQAATNLNGGSRPSWITDEDVYAATNNLMYATTGNSDNSAYITDPSTIKPTMEQKVMEAKQFEWTIQQGDATSELANLKNAELLAQYHKENADAAYSVAQLESLKASDEQARIKFVKEMEQLDLQSQLLMQQPGVNAIETSVDVAQLDLDASKQAFNMLTQQAA
ncbi:hypothetical protein HVY71_12480 [Citrobacter freundii]|nr:hypothetical protein HVY71_12480 [Citrobacter freundii]